MGLKTQTFSWWVFKTHLLRRGRPAKSPGSYFLTIWYRYGESERASTIMVPSDAPHEQIERVLQGYRRAV